MLKHEHFGKLRPHKHTSYAGLVFVLLLVGVLLAGLSWAAEAAPPAVNPQSGSVGLSGTVRGPAPSTAAVILVPKTGEHTTSIPVTVSGTCPTGTFVLIEKNNIFAGATSCEDDGTFSLLVDLFDGSNVLIAKVTDALGQSGPDSAPVTVFYDAPATVSTNGELGKQLFLETATTVAGTDPDVSLSRTVTIHGGVGPYAMSWDWGDGATSLNSQTSEGPATMGHVYKRAGTYRVIVRVTDSLGNSAFLQVVTVVNGPVSTYGSSHGTGLAALPGELVSAWPLYILAAGMVGLFWFGGRLEVWRLRRRHLIP